MMVRKENDREGYHEVENVPKKEQENERKNEEKEQRVNGHDDRHNKDHSCIAPPAPIHPITLNQSIH
jgi:hypothetical protein